MKTYMTMLLFFFATIAAHAQSETDQDGFTDKSEARNQLVNGRKEGKWCEYVVLKEYGTGKHKQISTVPTDDSSKATYYRLTIYKNDVPTGTTRQYFMSGELEGHVTYVDGKRQGTAMIFYPGGNKAGEIPFTDDKTNGVIRLYYQSGNLKSETPCTNGKQGKTKHYKEKRQRS